MRLKPLFIAGSLLILSGLSSVPSQGEGIGSGGTVTAATLFRRLTNGFQKPHWKLVGTTPLPFDVFHPQGLLKIGDVFYLSSVDIEEKPEKFLIGRGDRDRSPGKGRARLFKFDSRGHLLGQTTLGEGDLYHPGGLDYDGRWIWVPVAEYRPKSSTIVYKVDHRTLQVTEAFRVPDHIGGIAFNPEHGSLLGISWGAETFYHWTPEGRLIRKHRNRRHDVHYQDCHYAGDQAMICGGLEAIDHPFDGFFREGGLGLLDIVHHHVLGQIRSPRDKKKNAVMSRNAMCFEANGKKRLRFYFVPRDHASALYVFDLEEG
jgi:hypothetical protein